MSDTINGFTSKTLVDEIRSRSTVAAAAPRHETETAVSRVFDAITALTDRGESVTVRTFGTFKTKTRAGGSIKSPSTGEIVSFGPREALTFKQSKKA